MSKSTSTNPLVGAIAGCHRKLSAIRASCCSFGRCLMNQSSVLSAVRVGGDHPFRPIRERK